jgi:hypothetical protein
MHIANVYTREAMRREPPGVWLTRLTYISRSNDLAPLHSPGRLRGTAFVRIPTSTERFFVSLVYYPRAVDYATNLKTWGANP